jgi:hypothetical protein
MSATGKSSKRIIIKGSNHWQPVLLNMMKKAGIEADMLNLKGEVPSALWLFSSKSRPYRIIYHLGGCSGIFCILARLRGKRVVNHWIGTDVMRYSGKLSLRNRLGIWVHQHLVDLEFTDAKILQDELMAVGIKTDIVRLLSQTIIAEVTALPKEPTVLSYWHDERFHFYGGPIVFALAKAFPSVKFLITLATGKGLTEVPANIQFLGLVDNMAEVYRKCTCVIRMPQHDGFSVMVLEAMARGRYVIYNHEHRELSFTSIAKDFDSARKSLEEILNKREPNLAGADYVKKNFSIDNEAARLRKLMENAFGSV